ncbi:MULTISPECIES: SDR family oxidoreductase [Apibacter]|uniref:SDR family oxidoreductase n=1 Tax=Apibacter TaxID=1778601 RepID=UPI000CF9CC59|nr:MULTISPECIES: SDR family oxidoreductase [Apibacter]PQL90037.1 oxidoreductase [Apibacter sp. wkB309]
MKEKVIVVMGASSGIGEATVRKIAERGAKLVISARREEKLKAIKDSLPNAQIEYKVADVAKFEEVKAVVDLAISKYGKIDVIYNNAGTMPSSYLIDCKLQDWHDMLHVNVLGVLHGIAAVLPHFVKQKSGHIITTDSVAGHYVYPGSVVYCATKSAIRAVMEGLRQEQRENNIKSSMVSPGAVRTDLYKTMKDEKLLEDQRKMQDTEGYGLNPEDIAEAVVYAINTPQHVSVSEVIVRPTKQSL